MDLRIRCVPDKQPNGDTTVYPLALVGYGVGKGKSHACRATTELWMEIRVSTFEF